jgi:hypothetical protein
MNKLFAKLFKRKDKKAKAIDLSAASDTGLTLILLRVPVEDLIKNCTQVPITIVFSIKCNIKFFKTNVFFLIFPGITAMESNFVGKLLLA